MNSVRGREELDDRGPNLWRGQETASEDRQGKYSKTNERIDYVITGVNKKYQPRVIEELEGAPRKIRVRVLY